MKEQLQPYEYWYSKQQLSELVNAYHSVNDKQVIQSLQVLMKERTGELFQRHPDLAAYWPVLMDSKLTRKQFEAVFDELQAFVVPMKQPSAKQIDKIFRKVKKMYYPPVDSLDFRTMTFLGWNDPGTNRKYLLREKEGRLQGVYGSFRPDVQKGHCAICNQISTVGLFLATTKASADGTYTKKGNYICSNSEQCNQQVTQLETLERFWETVTYEK